MLYCKIAVYLADRHFLEMEQILERKHWIQINLKKIKVFILKFWTKISKIENYCEWIKLILLLYSTQWRSRCQNKAQVYKFLKQNFLINYYQNTNRPMKKNAKDIHEKTTDQYCHKKKKYHQGCGHHSKFNMSIVFEYYLFYFAYNHRL